MNPKKEKINANNTKQNNNDTNKITHNRSLTEHVYSLRINKQVTSKYIQIAIECNETILLKWQF